LTAPTAPSDLVRYGAGADALFARLAEPAEVGAQWGVNRYLHGLHSRRPDLREAYPDLEGDDGFRLVDWAYRHGFDEVPIPPELMPSDYLREPAPVGGDAGVTRYLQLLHARTPDLGRAFPDLAGADGFRFAEWAQDVGVRVDPVLRHLSDRIPRRVLARRPRGRPAPGVNVIGHLGTATGIGEAARGVVTALEAANVPLVSIACPFPDGGAEDSGGLEAAGFDTDFVCLNPDRHVQLARRLAPDWSAGRRTIGLRWWELADDLPPEWRLAFPLVDEVWVCSDHTAGAIAGIAPVPVRKVPLAVDPGPAAETGRPGLALPDGFLFLTMFDCDSTLDRKNPQGAVEAFRAAFAPGEGASLVLKSVNGDRHPDALERLRAAAGAHPDVHFLDGHLSRPQKNAMLAACDCFVSLHRAEGFGLPLAEAMHLGKPAIATGWSGNLEFMSGRNGYLVSHSYRRVGPGGEPYYSAEATWAEPDVQHAASLMREVFRDPEAARDRGARGAAEVRRRFSASAAGRAMSERIEELRRKASGYPAHARNGIRVS
jgi:glycosyltransferase involved in cell wall biosynthesis